MSDCRLNSDDQMSTKCTYIFNVAQLQPVKFSSQNMKNLNYTSGIPGKAKNSRSSQNNISQSLRCTACDTDAGSLIMPLTCGSFLFLFLLGIIVRQHLLLTFQPSTLVLVFNMLLVFVQHQTININEHVLKGGFFRNTKEFYFSSDELSWQHSHNMATSSAVGLTQQVTAPSSGRVD